MPTSISLFTFKNTPQKRKITTQKTFFATPFLKKIVLIISKKKKKFGQFKKRLYFCTRFQEK